MIIDDKNPAIKVRKNKTDNRSKNNSECEC